VAHVDLKGKNNLAAKVLAIITSIDISVSSSCMTHELESITIGIFSLFFCRNNPSYDFDKGLSCHVTPTNVFLFWP